MPPSSQTNEINFSCPHCGDSDLLIGTHQITPMRPWSERELVSPLHVIDGGPRLTCQVCGYRGDNWTPFNTLRAG